jgi:hypothetical protein
MPNEHAAVDQARQTSQTHPATAHAPFAARATLIGALTVAACAPAALAGTVDLPRSPAASPDGNVLVFSWRGDLWKVAGSGGSAIRLTAHPAAEGRSAFSPDGAAIVFDSDRDGSRNLYVMRSDGTAVRQLTFGDSACILAGTGLDGAGRPVAYFESSRENDLYRAARPYMVPLAGGPAVTRVRTSATSGRSSAPPGSGRATPTGWATTDGRSPREATSSTSRTAATARR